MPIYAYRCACGKSADVLVRSGREPRTCDEVPELALCTEAGALSRRLTAAYVGSSGGKSAPDPTCGACGSTPGSCAYDN